MAVDGPPIIDPKSSSEVPSFIVSDIDRIKQLISLSPSGREGFSHQVFRRALGGNVSQAQIIGELDAFKDKLAHVISLARASQANSHDLAGAVAADHLSSRLTALEQERDLLRHQRDAWLEDAESRVDQALGARDSALEQVSALNAAMKHVESKLDSEKDTLRVEMNDLRREISTSSGEFAQVKQENARLRSENASALQALNDRHAAHERHIKTLIDNHNDELNGHRVNSAQLQSKLQTRDQELANLKSDLEKSESKRNKDLARSHEEIERLNTSHRQAANDHQNTLKQHIDKVKELQQEIGVLKIHNDAEADKSANEIAELKTAHRQALAEQSRHLQDRDGKIARLEQQLKTAEEEHLRALTAASEDARNESHNVLQRSINEIEDRHRLDTEKNNRDHDKVVASLRTDIEQAAEAARHRLADLAEAHAAELNAAEQRLTTERESDIRNLQSKHDAAVQEMQSRHNETIREMEARAETAREEANNKLTDVERKLSEKHLIGTREIEDRYTAAISKLSNEHDQLRKDSDDQLAEAQRAREAREQELRSSLDRQRVESANSAKGFEAQLDEMKREHLHELAVANHAKDQAVAEAIRTHVQRLDEHKLRTQEQISGLRSQHARAMEELRLQINRNEMPRLEQFSGKTLAENQSVASDEQVLMDIIEDLRTKRMESETDANGKTSPSRKTSVSVEDKYDTGTQSDEFEPSFHGDDSFSFVSRVEDDRSSIHHRDIRATPGRSPKAKYSQSVSESSHSSSGPETGSVRSGVYGDPARSRTAFDPRRSSIASLTSMHGGGNTRHADAGESNGTAIVTGVDSARSFQARSPTEAALQDAELDISIKPVDHGYVRASQGRATDSAAQRDGAGVNGAPTEPSPTSVSGSPETNPSPAIQAARRASKTSEALVDATSVPARRSSLRGLLRRSVSPTNKLVRGHARHVSEQTGRKK